MSTEKPDAIALLKADHKLVAGLFEQFEAATSDARKLALVKQICTELTIHTLIEEEIFYPACKEKVEEDSLDEAYVEHDGAKMLIAELINSAPDEDFYDAKVKVLSEEITHHVKEEEAPADGLFAQARKAGLDMDALGDKLRARKEALKAQIEAKGLPVQKTRTLKGAPVEHAEPVA